MKKEAEEDKNIEKEKLKEIKENLDELKKGLDETKEELKSFKNVTKPESEKSSVNFIVYTTASGVIFYFVNYGLNKLMATLNGGGDSGKKESISKKAAVFKALYILNNDVKKLSHRIAKWTKTHENERITVKCPWWIFSISTLLK